MPIHCICIYPPLRIAYKRAPPFPSNFLCKYDSFSNLPILYGLPFFKNPINLQISLGNVKNVWLPYTLMPLGPASFCKPWAIFYTLYQTHRHHIAALIIDTDVTRPRVVHLAQLPPTVEQLPPLSVPLVSVPVPHSTHPVGVVTLLKEPLMSCNLHPA